MSQLIGPNPCHECGGHYGCHAERCSQHATKIVARQREADYRRGEALLNAIELRDAVEVGRILREGTAS